MGSKVLDDAAVARVMRGATSTAAAAIAPTAFLLESKAAFRRESKTSLE
jgi:hypothetical protein